jgi:quercetin dioxygenase-like cupin family protein
VALAWEGLKEATMLGRDYRDAPAEEVGEGITIRWVLGRAEGAPGFAMRVIEFQGGAVFAPHEHPYEHEIFVIEGEGVVTGADGEIPMRQGTAILVPAGEVHGYRNRGSGPLRFICVIPHQG